MKNLFTQIVLHYAMIFPRFLYTRRFCL